MVEVSMDTFFHEFGHFLEFEFNSGKTLDNPALSDSFIKAYTKAKLKLPTPNYHEGYGQIDSSTALSEAKATFFALLLPDKMFDDDASHQYYKINSYRYKFEVGDNNIYTIDWEHSKFKIAGLLFYEKWPYFSIQVSQKSLHWLIFFGTSMTVKILQSFLM